MNYKEAIAYIETLNPSLQIPSLNRIRAFLTQSGCPENSFASLHIGGTNGKGSTVAMLDSILRASKLKVARYTGPHLLRWNERFHIDGKPIEDAVFSAYVLRLKTLSENFAKANPDLGQLTWFELLTALAFFYFAENQVDIAVIEVGLGGRFDATNVIAKPLATAITNVSLDHTQILGETLEQIAFEKAGIIKSRIPLVTAAEAPAFTVIKQRADELCAPVVDCRKHSLYPFLHCALPGIHQRTNAQVALQTLQQAKLLEESITSGGKSDDFKLVSEDTIKTGLTDVYWPGRFQIIKSLGLILDGAHNLAGIQSLRASLDELFPEQSFRFIFACYENKNAVTMLNTLLKRDDSLYLSEVVSSRAVFSKTTLAKHAVDLGIQVAVFESVALALQSAVKERKPSEYVVATGSFATIKEIVLALGWSQVEDGR
jgi:dihydrofolate synthase/folylpolyglutamate synthase